MPASKIEWLVFDLGGVLFDFNGLSGICDLTGWSEEKVGALLLTSPAIEALGTGSIDPDTFGNNFARELDLDLTAAEMLEHWANWEAGPKPGALTFLEQLATTHRIACLTNNNVVHWQRLAGRYGTETLFEKCYLSQDLGLHKPDRRIFDHVISDLGVPPQAILYFDDVPENVRAAQACGLQAHRATCPEDIESTLKSLGIRSENTNGQSAR